jgi:hypothetical protein
MLRTTSDIYGGQLTIVHAREIPSRKPGATFIGEVKRLAGIG